MKLDEMILSEKLHGKEPTKPVVISEKNSTELGKLLNWYSFMADEKEIDNWATQYMKNKGYSKKDISQFINTNDVIGKRTTAALCRMFLNGIQFEGEVSTLIEDRIAKHINNTSTRQIQQEDREVVSIQDRIKTIADRYIIEIEDEIDTWFFDKKKVIDFSMYTFLQKHSISIQVANRIRSFIVPKIEEMELAKLKKDEQFEEAFSYLSRSRFTLILNSLNIAVKDIDRFVGNTKAAKPRATRKKKDIPVSKQINSLVYQKEFASLKIKSISPEQIIGASQLWTFNTKYNQLTVYNSLGPAGLGVKGTTLINFDEKSSQRKKIRKPKETIEKVLEGGKLVLRKILTEASTKPMPLNGRINSETILLRVIR